MIAIALKAGKYGIREGGSGDCACVRDTDTKVEIHPGLFSKGVCDSIDDIGRPGQTSIFWGLISDGLLRYGTHCVPAIDVRS